MKVYSISRWAFYGISFLILILPVSRHWDLLLRGKTAPGEVQQFDRFLLERRFGEDVTEMASTIEFENEGITYITRGPRNFEYRPGRMVKVRYDPKDPGRNCILTFSGFYLNNYTVLPLILITLWGAFYLSFNNYQKRKRSRRSATPAASSPYRFRNTNRKEGERGQRKITRTSNRILR